MRNSDNRKRGQRDRRNGDIRDDVTAGLGSALCSAAVQAICGKRREVSKEHAKNKLDYSMSQRFVVIVQYVEKKCIVDTANFPYVLCL